MLDAILLSMRRTTSAISNGNVVLIIENQPERQEGTLHCKWSGMCLFVGAINIQIYQSPQDICRSDNPKYEEKTGGFIIDDERRELVNIVVLNGTEFMAGYFVMVEISIDYFVCSEMVY